jgi:hypothetical protein
MILFRQFDEFSPRSVTAENRDSGFWDGKVARQHFHQCGIGLACMSRRTHRGAVFALSRFRDLR